MEVWGSAKYFHVSPILLLQKKIIRLITFLERLAQSEPLFLELNTLPIDKLIQDRIGLFMYKMHNGLHPPTINNMYIKNSDVQYHNTRHKNYLHVSMAHSDLYTKSFYCSSILIWNEIMNKMDGWDLGWWVGFRVGAWVGAWVGVCVGGWVLGGWVDGWVGV